MRKLVLMALLAALAVDAQEPVSFEVASVKPNRSGDRGGSLKRQAGGRVNAMNLPLSTLITFAYQVPAFLLGDAPGWVANERFDIVAKLSGDPGPEALVPAMRKLLEERFQLRTHLETREAAIYALVMAHPGGRPGPALKASTQDCSPEAVKERRAAPPPPPSPSTTALPVCGTQFGLGRIGFGGLPLSNFTSGIAGLLGRVVEDRTGLAGNWDFELTFAPETPAGTEPAAADPALPSIFTAVQEQLGLKLQAAKGPVKVLVIDRVERPIPD